MADWRAVCSLHCAVLHCLLMYSGVVLSLGTVTTRVSWPWDADPTTCPRGEAGGECREVTLCSAGESVGFSGMELLVQCWLRFCFVVRGLNQVVVV